MKRTLFKDALRNIRRQRVTYISIIVIAFLGAAAFLGIDYSALALRKNGSQFYNLSNYRDIELVSTLLLSPEDIEAVRGIEGVEEVERVWQIKVKVSSEVKKAEANVISLAGDINTPQLLEGSFPVKNTDCVVEKKLAEEMGWRTGDRIKLLDAEIGATEVLKNRIYDITGIADHPDHVSLNVPDTLYIMVTSDAFKMMRLSDCCMKGEIVISKPAGIDRFGDEYGEYVEAVSRRIEELAKQREPIRTVDAQRDFGTDDECKWYLFDCHGNPDFVQLIIGSTNLENVEMTFSLLFVLVGALVIYAANTKMADEQRELVGACKAFGLRTGEIVSKYLLYGVSSTVIGTAAGTFAARFFFEVFALNSYGVYYTFDITKPSWSVRPTVIVLVSGVLISVLATLIACGRLLRSPATVLMRPKVPAGGNGRKRGRKHLFPLYFRAIVMNILRDWKRVTVTVVCVGGCCALVVIGFTLRAAVQGSLDKQYGTIVDYDRLVRYDTRIDRNADEDDPTAAERIKACLDEAGCKSVGVYDTLIAYRVTDIQTAELLCGDIAEINEMYHLRDWITGEPVAPSDDGIFIQKRLAEIYGFDIGSEFEVAVSGNGTRGAKVRVAGIYNNYIGRFMLMTPAYYEKMFGSACGENAFFVKLNGADAAALEEKLKAVEGFESALPSDADKATFEASTSVVIAVVVIFIFMAAVMAGAVLLNLTYTYILQKKRELILMRVNGFTVKEVKRYVTRETVITTALGIVLGTALGAGIAYRILRSMEQPFVQFERGASIPSWLIGAGMTVLFTVIINTIALRQVKQFDLTDLNEA